MVCEDTSAVRNGGEQVDGEADRMQRNSRSAPQRSAWNPGFFPAEGHLITMDFI